MQYTSHCSKQWCKQFFSHFEVDKKSLRRYKIQLLYRNHLRYFSKEEVIYLEFFISLYFLRLKLLFLSTYTAIPFNGSL